MINSDYSAMVIRTVTTRAVPSLNVREYEWVMSTPVTRGRTL